MRLNACTSITRQPACSFHSASKLQPRVWQRTVLSAPKAAATEGQLEGQALLKYGGEAKLLGYLGFHV